MNLYIFFYDFISKMFYNKNEPLHLKSDKLKWAYQNI